MILYSHLAPFWETFPLSFHMEITVQRFKRVNPRVKFACCIKRCCICDQNSTFVAVREGKTTMNLSHHIPTWGQTSCPYFLINSQFPCPGLNKPGCLFSPGDSIREWAEQTKQIQSRHGATRKEQGEIESAVYATHPRMLWGENRKAATSHTNPTDVTS